VRLLRDDGHAMLLERLGPSLEHSGLPVEAQIEVLCGALRRAWEVPGDASVMTGAAKARWLGDFVRERWRALGEPCDERVIRTALAFAASRADAFDPATAVLVHGDAHAANALLDADGEYRLIDPDGLFAERACDLAVPLREWPREPGARERCALLSELTGVPFQPIWEWGYVERVSTGLLLLTVGREALGRDLLAAAEALT
jgi:streptomycin 6-kinase